MNGHLSELNRTMSTITLGFDACFLLDALIYGFCSQFEFCSFFACQIHIYAHLTLSFEAYHFSRKNFIVGISWCKESLTCTSVEEETDETDKSDKEVFIYPVELHDELPYFPIHRVWILLRIYKAMSRKRSFNFYDL